MTKALPQLRQEIISLRAERDRLGSERNTISRAPVDAATLEGRVDALIASALKEENDPFDGLADPEDRYVVGVFNVRALNNPFAAFARIAPKGLRTAMLQSTGEGGGLSDNDRAAKLAEVDAALSQTEIAEELLLREIDDQTGGLEYRRSDADPAIMLAPTSELQAATRPPKAGGLFRKAG